MFVRRRAAQHLLRGPKRATHHTRPVHPGPRLLASPVPCVEAFVPVAQAEAANSSARARMCGRKGFSTPPGSTPIATPRSATRRRPGAIALRAATQASLARLGGPLALCAPSPSAAPERQARTPGRAHGASRADRRRCPPTGCGARCHPEAAASAQGRPAASVRCGRRSPTAPRCVGRGGSGRSRPSPARVNRILGHSPCTPDEPATQSPSEARDSANASPRSATSSPVNPRSGPDCVAGPSAASLTRRLPMGLPAPAKSSGQSAGTPSAAASPMRRSNA